MALVFEHAAAADAPPAESFEFSATGVGSCRIDGPAGSVSGGRSQGYSATLVSRQPVAIPGLYGAYGAQADVFDFSGGSALPRRLQDYEAVLSVEYFQGAENVGTLTFRPGLYFENHPSSAAWDVPVDLAFGIPISSKLSGVLGFSNGRFFHHAVPVFGLVWTASPLLRIELVFPEPTVILTLDSTSELRLGGSLTGGGFLTDPRPTRTVVEYSSYLVGVEWSKKWRSGAKLAVFAGVEAERDFDYFKSAGRLHGDGAGFLKITASYAH
jgi:hypothetical protein